MTAFASGARPARYWHILLIPVLGVIFFLIATRIVNSVEYLNSDFFTFWLAGHLAMLGQNPYLADLWVGGHHQFGATWIPNATFIYPFPVALVFAPLGLLSTYQAYVVWVMLSQLMMVVALVLLLRVQAARLQWIYFPPLLAGLAIFHPTILTLLNGQFGGFLLLTLAGIVYLWEKGKWWEGCVLLPIVALKPSLGIPIILLLSLYLILRGRASLLLVAAACGMLLVSAGWLLQPNWIAEFWRAGSTKLSQTFGYSPTIWGVAAFFCRYKLNCAIGYGGTIAVPLVIGYAYLAGRKRLFASPQWVVSLAIILALLTTPYAWMYDQVLLIIPAVVVAMGLAEAGYAFVPISLLFIAIDVLAFATLGIAGIIQRGVWSVAVPLAMLGLLLWRFPRAGSPGTGTAASPT